MLFPSNIFLFCFLPVMLVLYYVCAAVIPKDKRVLYKNIVLLTGSIIFYAYGEHILTLILIFSIFFNYGMALWIEMTHNRQRSAKGLMILTVIVNIAVLFVYKYLDFSITNINRLFGFSIPLSGLVLPIGISFFTFQALSYVVDVYWQRASAQKNPLYVGLYISLFPQLVAGPIVRYDSIALQMKERQENLDKFGRGVMRFIVGIGKKVLLADTMALFADRIFAMENSTAALSVSMAWLGAISYTLQIYYDFSGYSDMAIGLGEMFGFEFQENFNYPYIAKSVTEYWHRWHISLSTWFRDYVFYPVQRSALCSVIRTKMRKSGHKKLMRIIPSFISMFAVWSLTGIWHGANWTFLFWGIIFFIFQFIEEITEYGKKWHLPWGLAHIYTMLVVVLSFVLFKSNTIHDAIRYLGRMFGVGSKAVLDRQAWFYIKDNWVFFLLAILFTMPVGKKLEKHAYLWQPGLAIVLLLSIVYILKGTYSPFIYFSF